MATGERVSGARNQPVEVGPVTTDQPLDDELDRGPGEGGDEQRRGHGPAPAPRERIAPNVPATSTKTVDPRRDTTRNKSLSAVVRFASTPSGSARPRSERLPVAEGGGGGQGHQKRAQRDQQPTAPQQHRRRRERRGGVRTWLTQPSDEVGVGVEAAAAEVVSMSGGTGAGHRVLHPAGDPGRPTRTIEAASTRTGEIPGSNLRDRDARRLAAVAPVTAPLPPVRWRSTGADAVPIGLREPARGGATRQAVAVARDQTVGVRPAIQRTGRRSRSRPSVRQYEPASTSSRAIARAPQRGAAWSRRGSIHCTAASASSGETPRASRSANCQGVTAAVVGMCRSMNRAHEVQKAQSPS